MVVVHRNKEYRSGITVEVGGQKYEGGYKGTSIGEIQKRQANAAGTSFTGTVGTIKKERLKTGELIKEEVTDIGILRQEQESPIPQVIEKDIIQKPIEQPKPLKKPDVKEIFTKIDEKPYGEKQKVTISEVKRLQEQAKQERANYRGTLRAATSEESKALKYERSLLGQFTSGLKGGFFEDSGAGQKARTGSTAQALGLTTGAVLTMIPAGKAGKGVKAGKSILGKIPTGRVLSWGGDILSFGGKAVSKGKSIISKAPKGRVATFLKGLGISVASQEVIIESSKRTGEYTAPSAQQDIIRSEGFRNIMGAGFAAEREAIKGQAWYKQIGYEISPFFSNDKAFAKEVREQFKARGLTGKELETAVSAAKRQRTAGATGEAITLLELSRQSERQGRKLIGLGFEKAQQKGVQVGKKKIGGELAKRAFIPIGAAGFQEGVSQTLAQQRAREQKIDIGKVGIGGGLGFASAGVIGTAIVGFRPNKPALSKTIEFGSYLTDPFEKGGDILADVSEIASRKLGKTTVRPVVRMVNTPTEIFSFGVEKRGKKIPKAPTVPISPTVPIKTPTPAQVPTSLDDIIKSPIKVPIDTTTPTETPVDIPVNIPVDTPTNINTNMPTFTDISTQISTSTPVSIPFNIPTRTPILRVPPPLPLTFGFGSAKGSVRKGKKRLYIRELQLGRAVIGEFLGVGRQPKRTAIKRRRRKK